MRQTGGIDEKIADSLASYFMEHSSLKKTYGIVNNIINLIINNNDLYNFINQTPMCDGTSNLYKNYSLDYIFNNDKLVKVYYNNWNNYKMKAMLIDMIVIILVIIDEVMMRVEVIQ